MAFSGAVWRQLKSTSADDLIRALEKDGWECDMAGGSIRIYRHPATKRRVSIHYHPHRTYGPGMLKMLLDDIGWSEDQLRALKLLKKP